MLTPGYLLGRLSIAVRSEGVRAVAVSLALSAIYFWMTCWIASVRYFWSDEFFTLYLARLPADELWRALQTGADQHPWPFYVLSGAAIRWFGESELALRIPSILAFWTACLVMGCFVARRTSLNTGLVAALVLPASGLFGFAFEARGYALVLGCSALALVGWQGAREQHRRLPHLLLIAVGVMGAVSSHYYALLLLVPLGLAEIVRSCRTRRIDPAAWFAGATALLPLLVCLPLIRSASGFSTHFWSQPSVSYFLVYFNGLIGGAGTTPLLAMIFMLAIYACRPSTRPEPLGGGLALDRRPDPVQPGKARQETDHQETGHWETDHQERGHQERGHQERGHQERAEIPIEEVVLGVALLGVQALALVAASFLTNAFHPRYAIVTWLAAPLLLGFALHRPLSRYRLLPVVMMGGLVAWFVLIAVQVVGTERAGIRRLDRLAAWTERKIPGNARFVLACNDEWYRACYYGPPELQSRIAYPADPERSAKYLGHDTVDRCGLALRPWFDAKMEGYDDFVSRHEQFHLVTDLNSHWRWMYRALRAEGARLELVDRLGNFFLFRVTMRPADDSASPVNAAPDA